MSTSSSNHCPQCGTPLPANAPAGLCPRCVMAMNMASQTDFSDPGAEKVPQQPPTPAELASKFPQLEILELLGRGGMGAVYKARQKELDRIVALKILPPAVGDNPAFAERFAREAKALARLNHPNIVTLYEFGRADGLFFFLMEFVDGVNLRQLLNAGRVEPREALAIVPQICDALQYAHDHGIVHRDIKPENILMDRRGRVKVADFGLAKLMGADATVVSSALPAAEQGSGLTDAGKVMGTPQYMAPEQKESPLAVDHRADIYALGVVFYQMLTGELPGQRIEPPSHKVQIDVRLDEIVLRALEKNPALRYEQASVFKTHLEGVSSGGSGAPPPSFSAAGTRENSNSEEGEIEEAKRKVRIPAIGLMLAGAINILVVLAALVTILVSMHQVPGGSMRAVLFLVPLTLVGIGGAFNILGGMRMFQLRSRTLAILGSIAAIGTPPGFLLGLPFGIWALIVLSGNKVQRAFQLGRSSNGNSSNPPAANRSESSGSRPPMPWVMWIALVVLIVSTLCNLVLLPRTGYIMVYDFIFKAILIFGLFYRSRLAYAATIASAMFALGLMVKAELWAALLGTFITALVVLPILLSTRWFFPAELSRGRKRAWLWSTGLVALVFLATALAAPARFSTQNSSQRAGVNIYPNTPQNIVSPTAVLEVPRFEQPIVEQPVYEASVDRSKNPAADPTLVANGTVSNPVYLWCGPESTAPHEAILPHGVRVRLVALGNKATWWSPTGDPVESKPDWEEFRDKYPDQEVIGIVEIDHPVNKRKEGGGQVGKIGPAGEEHVLPIVTARTVAHSMEGGGPQIMIGFGAGPWRRVEMPKSPIDPVMMGLNDPIFQIVSRKTLRRRDSKFPDSKGSTEVRFWMMGPPNAETALVAIGKDGREQTLAYTWGAVEKAIPETMRRDVVGWVDMENQEIARFELRSRPRNWTVFAGFATEPKPDENSGVVLADPYTAASLPGEKSEPSAGLTEYSFEHRRELGQKVLDAARDFVEEHQWTHMGEQGGAVSGGRESVTIEAKDTRGKRVIFTQSTDPAAGSKLVVMVEPGGEFSAERIATAIARRLKLSAGWPTEPSK